MKPLCGQPNCADPACRRDHEFSEPETSIVSMPASSHCRSEVACQGSTDVAAVPAGHTKHEAQAGEECDCADIFACSHRIDEIEVMRETDARRKIKPASPLAGIPIHTRGLAIWQDRSELFERP